MHTHYTDTRRRLRVQLALLSAAILTGCASYESEFQCKAPIGMPCRSLQTVYNTETAIPALPPVPDPARQFASENAEQWTPPVKTVWIAPYIDNAGRRHEASIMRLIVFAGARAINAEPEFLLPPIPDTNDGGESIAPPPPPPTMPTPSPHLTPGRPQEQTRGPVGMPSNLTPGSFTPPTPQAGKPLTGFGLPGY